MSQIGSSDYTTREIPDPLVNSIFLSQVTQAEISTILNTLKNGAPGYNEINACLLKQISQYIVDPLTRV